MDPEKQEERLTQSFRDVTLPKLVQEGRFPTGPNPRLDKCNFTITERWTDHFASCPYFAEVVIDSDTGPTHFDLLVKFPPQDDEAVTNFRVDRQFLNETRMYNEVLGEFRRVLSLNPKAPRDLVEQLTAKSYYGHYDDGNPKASLLVLENLRKSGYRPAESRVFLDYEHCAAAMRQIGRFHALSLSLKIEYPEVLERLKTTFVECRYFEDPIVREQCDVFHHRCNQRGIDYLLSSEGSGVPKDYVLNFRKLLSNPYELIVKVIEPEEPLSLICHGDFCRNNMAFRYDNGRVADIKLFDFQTPKYASPSIDLAFFMYLNTTQELRDEHFDDLLRIYHDNLIATAAAILDTPESRIAERFPFKLFADDFARRAVYGYFLAAFFLAAMSGKCEVDFSLSPDEQADILCAMGGEEVTQHIANIILDFHKRGFYAS